MGARLPYGIPFGMLSAMRSAIRGRDGLRRTVTREGAVQAEAPGGYPPLSPPRRRGSRRSHVWAPASPFEDPLQDAKRDAKGDEARYAGATVSCQSQPTD